MFTPVANQKIWLCTTPVDMRKSFNGSNALVLNNFFAIIRKAASTRQTALG